LLAPAEPSDIVQRSSNPPPPTLPPRFVDVVAKDDEAAEDTGDVSADRAEIGFIAGIAAYVGAAAGVELGRTCDEEDESVALSAPKDWGCVDWIGFDVTGVDVVARRSMRLGLAGAAAAATGAAPKGLMDIDGAAGGEDGAAWKSAKSSSPPAVKTVRWLALTLGPNNSDAPFSLIPSGASAGSAFSFAAEVVAPAALELAAGSLSSKSSKFITGAGTGSGALPVAFDCAVDDRVWLVVVAVVRRGEVSSSPASYCSKSFLLDTLSRNPPLLPPPE
jgi:hypothetical protein